MPSGAAVVRREGKRGTTFAIKWRDHDGRQCWETLGREPEWNEANAQRELGKRLEQVEREQWRKPGGVTFAAFADRFTSNYLPGRNLKPSTDADYRSIITGRLVPFFGPPTSPGSTRWQSTRTSPTRRRPEWLQRR
jgi:hypothetical protein